MLKLDIDTHARIRKLDITTQRIVSTSFMGNYASAFKGRGIVFESFREYSPADDASYIDWKASTRAGKLLVREFVEERNLEVFFLIDASHTMVFGSQKKLKHEYAADMVAAMSFAILQAGDAVGVGLFSDAMRGFLIPRQGAGQYRAILRELVNPDNYDRACNIGGAVHKCVLMLKPNTIIFLVTDLVGLEGSWELYLKIANKKFEVLPIIVRDPRDDDLPTDVGPVIVEDAYTGAQMLINTGRIREAYARAAKEIYIEKTKILHHANIIDMALVNTSKDFITPVISYLERRKRRWR